MRDDDKRPPLRGAVYAESGRQTHIQECVRKNTRGMRRKARRADQNHESGNRSRKEKGKTGIAKGATMNGRPSIFDIIIVQRLLSNPQPNFDTFHQLYPQQKVSD